MKNNIEKLRKEFGWTQDEFADKLQVSRQTVSSLENSRYNPSILLSFKISKLFDRSIEEIFIYEENNNEK